MTGCSPLLFDDCGGLDEGGDIEEYGSESDGMVNWEPERSCGGDGESLSGLEAMMEAGAVRAMCLGETSSTYQVSLCFTCIFSRAIEKLQLYNKWSSK